MLFHLCTLPLFLACLLNKPLPDSIQHENFSTQKFPSESIKVSFYNILTTHVTDKKPRKSAFPQYQWKNRKKAFIQLLQHESPDILGLCELDLRQVQTIENECVTNNQLKNYRLFGFSAETNLTIEEAKSRFRENDHVQYGEFIAFLVNMERIEVKSVLCHPLPSGKQQKWKRVLVEALFTDTVTGTDFVCLISHFDHKNREARQYSAKKELARIQQLEEQHIPWFSLGDRNWYRNEEGERAHQQYVQPAYIGDFRDDTLFGVYGHPGTFPGHLRMGKSLPPPIVELEDHSLTIDAPCVSTGYTSKNLVEKLIYYTKTGEFDPATGDLLNEEQPSNLAARNLVSDHYLFGGIFRFK